MDICSIPVARRATILSVLILSLLLPATSASAHDLGHRIPDGGDRLNISYHSVTANFQAATNWNINNNLHPTHIGTIGVHTNQVDHINVFDSNYSPLTWSGLWDCVAYSGNVCTQANVHYNLNRTWRNDSERRWVACHEFAHAVGSDHYNGSGSCVHSTVPSGTVWLHDHTITEINSWY